METTQIVIAVVSVTLTILIVVLSIQVWYILKEIRLSIHKMNKMLDDAGKVTGSVSESVSEMSGFMNGIKAGLKLITSVVHKGETHE